MNMAIDRLTRPVVHRLAVVLAVAVVAAAKEAVVTLIRPPVAVECHLCLSLESVKEK